MKPVNKKETTTKEIAQNVFMHTSKMALKNTEDLAHTLYTYTVSRNFKQHQSSIEANTDNILSSLMRDCCHIRFQMLSLFLGGCKGDQFSRDQFGLHWC